MKIINIKRLMTLAAVLMLVFTSAGITLAYFSASSHSEGTAVLNLKAQSEIGETVADDGTKTVNIKNTGDTDLVVRVAVYGPWLTEEDQAADMSYDSDDWELINGYYYYKHILEAGGSTASPLTAKISGIPADSDIEDFTITVIQQASIVTYADDGSVVKPDEWENIPSISE